MNHHASTLTVASLSFGYSPAKRSALSPLRTPVSRRRRLGIESRPRQVVGRLAACSAVKPTAAHPSVHDGRGSGSNGWRAGLGLRLIGALWLGLVLTVALPAAERMTAPPAVGERAPDFTLATVEGKRIRLSEFTARSPVVLVFLRGWPGYQCPLCTRQVQDLIAHAGEFAARGARVLLVYPGPAAQLVAHAEDFLKDKAWPADFTLVVDPDYQATLAYQLRWDAPKETAYPATFVLERGGLIRSAQVSRTHGDRVNAARALAALE